MRRLFLALFLIFLIAACVPAGNATAVIPPTGMPTILQTATPVPTDTLAQRKEKVLKNLDGMIAIGDKMRGG